MFENDTMEGSLVFSGHNKYIYFFFLLKKLDILNIQKQHYHNITGALAKGS